MLFCAPEEMAGWVAAVMQEFDLAALVFEHGSTSGSTESAGALLTRRNVARIVLMPRSEAVGTVEESSVDSLERGWLEVRPGSLLTSEGGRVLLLSEATAPTNPRSVAQPCRWLDWLKRRMKRDGVVAGVRGRHTHLPGEATYHDIRYSKGALDLLGDGTTWKQSAPGLVVFEPAAPTPPPGAAQSPRP
jgi:hypothetical protein